jgi:hypothetical protein
LLKVHESFRMINYACVTLGARIAAHSLQCPPPSDFTSAITPVLNPAQADGQYAAADRPLPEGENEDWFVIDLGQERLIHELEIEWYAACEVGIDFTLEWQQHEVWSVCLGETAGDRMARDRWYR